MRAYVKVIYSSEGASPTDVENALKRCGFRNLKGSSVFEMEIEDDMDFSSKLDSLHNTLKGLEVRYMVSTRIPEEVSRQEMPSYRERLEKWRVLGIDVDELIEILERDVEEFRQRAKEILASHVDRIADERLRELQEEEARRKLEEAREGILEAIKSGGKSFHELSQQIQIDVDILSEILDDMIEKGMIRPEQQGRKVLFVMGE